MVAEAVGFEPTDPRGSLVFKTSALNHSATLPSPGGARPSPIGYRSRANGLQIDAGALSKCAGHPSRVVARALRLRCKIAPGSTEA